VSFPIVVRLRAGFTAPSVWPPSGIFLHHQVQRKPRVDKDDLYSGDLQRLIIGDNRIPARIQATLDHPANSPIFG
jgi:hypothetical protein